jgi:hypothetical protein
VPWLEALKAQNEGAWKDDPAVVTPLQIEALSFHPPANIQAKLDAAFKNGRMSAKTYQTLTEAVTKARAREQRLSEDAKTRRERSAGTGE